MSKRKANKYCRVCGESMIPDGARGFCAMHYRRWRMRQNPYHEAEKPLLQLPQPDLFEPFK